MTRIRRAACGDDGVTLVLALIFITVVALFATVALDKAASTSQTGQQLRDRGQLQYALDAGVDRALQVLRKDISSQTPASPATLCTSPGAAVDVTQEAAGLIFNGHSIRYSCQTLSGSAADANQSLNTNFAVVLTSTASNALNTASGQATGQNVSCSNPGAALKVTGPLYLAGPESDVGASKRILICDGDYVRYSSSAPACSQAELNALQNVIVDVGHLKGCTEQTLDQAVAKYALPQAPTQSSAGFYLDVPVPNVTPNPPVCRVFFPGKYGVPPAVRAAQVDGNYFVSGLYYFEFNGTWSIGSNTSITAGRQALASDVTATGGSSACTAAGVTDSSALGALGSVLPAGLLSTGVTNYYFSGGGAQFVLGFKAKLSNAGVLTLNTPPAPNATTPGMSFVAARSSTDPGQVAGQGDVARGYTRWQDNSPVLTNQSASTAMVINGKVMAPSAPIELTASNPTDGVVRGGLIAETLRLGASVQGGGLALSTPSYLPNSAPPPYRTVRVVASEPGGSADTNVAVATISNYAPFSVVVRSWRTD